VNRWPPDSPDGNHVRDRGSRWGRPSLQPASLRRQRRLREYGRAYGVYS